MRVLVCHTFDPSTLPGHEVITCEPHEIADHLNGVDVVLPWNALVDRKTLQLGTFGLVYQPGAGLDTVDIEDASKLGVWVGHIPSNLTGNAESVAEHAVFLALAVSRRIHEAEAALTARKIGVPVGSTLFGKTACIIGLGNIGSRVAQRLQAFGMTLVGVNPHPVQIGGVVLKTLKVPGDLGTSVTDADYVFVCASGDKRNDGLISREILSAMKPGAFLINVARGGLVDIAALRDALKSGHLAGAGLDVFTEEPVDPNEPLLKLPNVVATPHIGGATTLNQSRTQAVLRRNIDAYSRGERIEGLVNEPEKPRFPFRNAAQREHQNLSELSEIEHSQL